MRGYGRRRRGVRRRRARGGRTRAPSAARARTGRARAAAGGRRRPRRARSARRRRSSRRARPGRRAAGSPVGVRGPAAARRRRSAPTSSLTCWRSSTSTRSAQPVSVGSAGRKTVATRSPGSFGRRRTTRPTAWRKKRSVRLTVAYAATTRRGTSTPSLTMFTATSQRGALGVAAGEAIDPRVRLRLVAHHHDRLLAGDRAQQRGGRAGVRAVVAEHQAGGVRDHGARLHEQRVGVAQHLRQQRRARVDRRAQPARVVGRVELVGERRDRLLRVHAPAQRGVEQPERERAADVVGDRVAIAVDEIGRAAALVVVADERDRARVGAKRRPGQREPPGARRRTRRAAPCPRSPTRRRDGSRRGRRTSAARGGARTDPAPTRPAGRSRRRRRRRRATRRRRCASADRDAARRASAASAHCARSAVVGHTTTTCSARGGADRVAGRERLAGPGCRDEQEVRSRVRRVAREKLGLPGPRRDHARRAPFSRLQRGHSAWPFAGSVAPPALTGSTWSACQPGPSGVTARGAAPARGEEQGDTRFGTELTRVHGAHSRIRDAAMPDARCRLDAAVPSTRWLHAQAPTPAGPRRAVGGVPPPRDDGLPDAAGRVGRALGGRSAKRPGA